MNKACAMTLAVAVALGVSACGKADAPTGPVAASTIPSSSPPDSAATPPPNPAPEVALPPLPANITAAPDPAPAAVEAKARDTAANDPKGQMSPEAEANSMPKAAQGNNHSSPSLESTPRP